MRSGKIRSTLPLPTRVTPEGNKFTLEIDLSNYSRGERDAANKALGDQRFRGRISHKRFMHRTLVVRLIVRPRTPQCNEKVQNHMRVIMSSISTAIEQFRREQAMAAHPAGTGPTLRRRPVGATLH